MTRITFNKQRQAIITIDNVGNDISFLVNLIFDNSLTNLKRDIQLCDNEVTKEILKSFYKYLESIPTLDDEMSHTQSSEDEVVIEFESGSCGDWCAIVHNVEMEHSGYWYAAQDLEAERRSLIELRHKLKGIEMAVRQIDEVVDLVKNANSEADAASRLMELGLDLIQSKSILRMRVANLVAYSQSEISDEISQCEAWIKFIDNCR